MCPPTTTAAITGRPHLHTELFLSNLKCFDQFPCIFLLSAEKHYWLKSLCLPTVLQESHCNEKQSSSINNTTCSAGTISYLLLNGLIGSELGKKWEWKGFLWFWCAGAKCFFFPARVFWILLFGFVGVLGGLNITECNSITSVQKAHGVVVKMSSVLSFFPYPLIAEAGIY